ncbi:MAG TPA: adenine deaminase [Ktedonobacterales bacterium]|jgi:adenine deaminase
MDGQWRDERRALIQVARGKAPADLVLRNARLVNVFSNEIQFADVAIYQDRVAGIGAPGSYGGAREVDLNGQYLAPGLIEAHTHIESALLTPGEFARAIAPHGTTTSVSDPHEIANVRGMDGLRWTLAAAEHVPIDLLFTLPSCVPASQFESSGAVLRADDLRDLAKHVRIASVGEVMNYPAVIAGDETMLDMIALGQPDGARSRGMAVDGHAPGLIGLDLCGYVAAGVQSDHETVAADEALEKIRLGMWLFPREGTMRNLEALLPVILEHHPERACFVADDKTCHDLLRLGELDHIIRLAIAGGLDPVRAIKMASLYPAQYFGFADRGAIAPGYRADLVVVPNLAEFRPTQVYVGGVLVAENGEPLFSAPALPADLTTNVSDTIRLANFGVERLRLPGTTGAARVIGMIPNQIVTNDLTLDVTARDGYLVADPERDILKVAVVERYGRGQVGVGLLHGLGLRAGAMASSVAHDAHNIVVAGTNDEDMALAICEVERMQGGLVVTRGGGVVESLALPIGGLVSPLPATDVAKAEERLEASVRDLGVQQPGAFIFLAFLALSVVPKLKITDRGLLDVAAWQIAPVQA